MIAILSLFIIIIASVLIVRIATIALVQTGLSKDVAKFQARSAFSGSGYTTRESEQIVGHPVRRNIISSLMLLGSAGVVTAISSLVLSFVSSDPKQTIERLLFMSAGLIILFFILKSKFVDRKVSDVIKWALSKYSSIDVHDYEDLLRVQKDYSIAEITISQENSLAGKTLLESRLLESGVMILGINKKDGSYIGVPKGGDTIEAGDIVLTYGKREKLKGI